MTGASLVDGTRPRAGGRLGRCARSSELASRLGADAEGLVRWIPVYGAAFLGLDSAGAVGARLEAPLGRARGARPAIGWCRGLYIGGEDAAALVDADLDAYAAAEIAEPGAGVA